MNSVRLNSLKYQRFTTPGSKDIVIRKVEFETRTQFFCFLTISCCRIILSHKGFGFQTEERNKTYINIFLGNIHTILFKNILFVNLNTTNNINNNKNINKNNNNDYNFHFLEN